MPWLDLFRASNKRSWESWTQLRSPDFRGSGCYCGGPEEEAETMMAANSSSTRRRLDEKRHRSRPRVPRTELHRRNNRLKEPRSSHGHLPGAGEQTRRGA